MTVEKSPGTSPLENIWQWGVTKVKQAVEDVEKALTPAPEAEPSQALKTEDTSKVTTYHKHEADPTAKPASFTKTMTPPQVAETEKQMATMTKQLKALEDKIAELEKKGAPPNVDEAVLKKYNSTLQELKENMATLKKSMADLKGMSKEDALKEIHDSSEDLDCLWFAMYDLGKLQSKDGKPLVDSTTISDMQKQVDNMDFGTLEELEDEIKNPGKATKEELTASKLKQIKDLVAELKSIDPKASVDTPEGQRRAELQDKLKALGVQADVKLTQKTLFGFDWLWPDDASYQFTFTQNGVAKKFDNQEELLKHLESLPVASEPPTKPTEPPTKPTEPHTHEPGKVHDHEDTLDKSHDSHHNPAIIAMMTRSGYDAQALDGWLHVIEHMDSKEGVTDEQMKQLGITKTQQGGKTVYQYKENDGTVSNYASLDELVEARLKKLGVTVANKDGKTVFQYHGQDGEIKEYQSLPALIQGFTTNRGREAFSPAIKPDDTLDTKIVKYQQQVEKNKAGLADAKKALEQAQAALDQLTPSYEQRMQLLDQLKQPPPQPIVWKGFFPTPNPDFLTWQQNRQKAVDELGKLGIQVKQENGKEVYYAQTGPDQFEKFESIDKLQDFSTERYKQKLVVLTATVDQTKAYIPYAEKCAEQTKQLLEVYKMVKQGSPEHCEQALKQMVGDLKPGETRNLQNGVRVEEHDGKHKYFVGNKEIGAGEAAVRLAEGAATAAQDKATAEYETERKKIEGDIHNVDEAQRKAETNLDAGTKAQKAMAILQELENTKDPARRRELLQQLSAMGVHYDPETHTGGIRTKSGHTLSFTYTRENGFTLTTVEGKKRSFKTNGDFVPFLAEMAEEAKKNAKLAEELRGEKNRFVAKHRHRRPEVVSWGEDQEQKLNGIKIRGEDIRKGWNALADAIGLKPSERNDLWNNPTAENVEKYRQLVNEREAAAAQASSGETSAAASDQGSGTPRTEDGTASKETKQADQEREKTTRDLKQAIFSYVFTQKVSQDAALAEDREKAITEMVRLLMEERKTDALRVRDQKLAEEKRIQQYHDLLQRLGLSPEDMVKLVHDEATAAPKFIKDRVKELEVVKGR